MFWVQIDGKSNSKLYTDHLCTKISKSLSNISSAHYIYRDINWFLLHVHITKFIATKSNPTMVVWRAHTTPMSVTWHCSMLSLSLSLSLSLYIYIYIYVCVCV